VGNIPVTEFRGRVDSILRGKALPVEESYALLTPVTFPFSYSGYSWPHPPNPLVNLRINENTGDTTGEGAAIQAAAATWNAAAAKFSFNYVGTITATAYSYNGANEVLFANLGSGGSLAQAITWTVGSTIVECDIEFNDYYTWSTAATLPSGQHDAQTIALHEFGHFLCLSSLDDIVYSVGSPNGESPSRDDIQVALDGRLG